MSFIVPLRATVVALGLIGSSAASAQTSAAPSPSSSAASTANAPSGELRQQQALGVLSAINQAEINAGQLALSRAQTEPARQYAQAMIRSHTENEKMLAAWKPDRSSAPAQAKTAEAKAEAAALARHQGAAFDSAYLQAMVKDHRKALQTLDDSLLPAATDAEVRAFLQKTRGHVADHLAQAERLAGTPATGR